VKKESEFTLSDLLFGLGKDRPKRPELKPDKPAIQKAINEAMKKRTVRVKSVLP
jgi:hypothetical protein